MKRACICFLVLIMLLLMSIVSAEIFTGNAVPLAFAEAQTSPAAPALFDAGKTEEQLLADYYSPVGEMDEREDLPLRLCRFYEDGIQRNLLILFDESTGKCYDAMNGRYVFIISPDEAIIGKDPQMPAEDYFLPNTLLENAAIDYSSDWLMHWYAKDWLKELVIPGMADSESTPDGTIPDLPIPGLEGMSNEEQRTLAKLVPPELLSVYFVSINDAGLEIMREYAPFTLTMSEEEKVAFTRQMSDMYSKTTNSQQGEQIAPSGSVRPSPPELKENYRAWYETVFPKANRFPRIQETASDHPLSQIPRTLDDVPLSPKEIEDIQLIRTYYAHNYQLYFFARPVKMEDGGLAYHEMFTDALLYTKGPQDWPPVPNTDILQAYLPGIPLLEGDKKQGYAKGEYVHDFRELVQYDRKAYDREAGALIHRQVLSAKTVGDLRRAYERLPQMYWFLPPLGTIR